jgi:hypothetical protein
VTTRKSTEDWYEGGCHCGAVRFRVRPRGRRVLECNCSICAKKGFLGLIVPPEDFELVRGEDALETYRFNTRVAEHRFCRTCGIHPFSRPRSHPGSYDTNLRCLDAGVGSFEVVPFDGQRWEESVASIRSVTMAIVGFVSCLVMALGCDTSFVEAGPGEVCREVGTQCVLAKGPLGVCEQIQCANDAEPPCFVCTPQH